MGVEIERAGRGPFPQWMLDMEDAVEIARQTGWLLTTDIRFTGKPYVFRDEIHLSEVTIERNV